MSKLGFPREFYLQQAGPPAFGMEYHRTRKVRITRVIRLTPKRSLYQRTERQDIL